MSNIQSEPNVSEEYLHPHLTPQMSELLQDRIAPAAHEASLSGYGYYAAAARNESSLCELMVLSKRVLSQKEIAEIKLGELELAKTGDFTLLPIVEMEELEKVLSQPEDKPVFNETDPEDLKLKKVVLATKGCHTKEAADLRVEIFLAENTEQLDQEYQQRALELEEKRSSITEEEFEEGKESLGPRPTSEEYRLRKRLYEYQIIQALASTYTPTQIAIEIPSLESKVSQLEAQRKAPESSRR